MTESTFDEIMKEDTEKALVVTTEWRGVFFGYGVLTKERTITLRDCRMCINWDASVRGILGLTSGQSLKNCRITPSSPRVTLQGVTAIFEVTEKAEQEWLKQPWA